MIMLKGSEKMQNKHICIHNLCDSCLHIFNEQSFNTEACDMSCFAMKKACHNQQKYCVNCGQVLQSIEDFSKDLSLLQSALKNKNIKVIGFVAPSVRVSLGDEFGLECGTNVQGKMISALRKLGFHQVFDMNIAADFTIMEESSEFIKRLKNNKNLPMFTSCCPGWINYVLKVCPQYINNLTTCKSPQQIFGSLINTFYAKENNFKSTDMFVVSIVPCLAKKLENKQDGLNTNVGFDVDVAITTKELAKIIKSNKIDFLNLEDQDYDTFFGSSSGAGAIFGNTGGVSEAVLRTAGETLTNGQKKNLDYAMVRGLNGIKTTTINLDNRQIKIAVVSGLKNLNTILDELKENPDAYHFIEVMACEGGCIGGGGQPTPNIEKSIILKARAEGLYNYELTKQYKKAHENPAISKIYKKYIGVVGGTNAKKLLHRHYTK